MKQKVILAMILFFTIMFYGCANIADSLKPETLNKIENISEYGFLYLTYVYAGKDKSIENANASDNSVGFIVTSIDDNEDFAMDFSDEHGYQLFNLKPGKYKISRTVYMNTITRRINGTITPKREMHFTIKSNEILYLGNYNVMLDSIGTFTKFGINMVSDLHDIDYITLTNKFIKLRKYKYIY